jgi:Cu/Ag efflux pump CusA
MPRMSRKRWCLLAALLVPCLVVVVVVAFFGYRFLKRLPGMGETTPEPMIVEVAALFPGASPEEVERQVTIPLEVGFAGTPHLQTVRSQSSFGMAAVRLRFDDSTDYHAARQEVINRLQFLPPLPAGVTPVLSSVFPEIFRYTLVCPRDAGGRPVYTLNDLRSLQDWVIEREFRRVPRIVDDEGRGGTRKRYEVHLDADRLHRHGVTLKGLLDAIAGANGNAGGDFITGPGALNVRGVGLFGGGEDPVEQVAKMKDPEPAAAAARLREEEDKRLREIRSLVLATVNDRAVLVEDVVEGGRLAPGGRLGERGVIVGARPQGNVALTRRLHEGVDWRDEERVEGIVFLRRGEDPEAALRDIRAKVEELNAGDRLLPGVRIEPLIENGGRPEDGFWLRADFPGNITPERLTENLRQARAILQRDEVAAVLTETDGPDTTTPRPGSATVFVRLKPGAAGSREAGQLRDDLVEELRRKLPGVTWSHSPRAPDHFAQMFEAAPGESLVKVFGRDLAELQEVAERLDEALRRTAGVEDVRRADGGQTTRFEVRVDRQKCLKWGVRADDVTTVLETALDGKTCSVMLEGEKQFDITVRWQKRQGGELEAILDLPLDIVNDQLQPAGGLPDLGKPVATAPRLRLRDLVSPVGSDGDPDPKGNWMRPTVPAIFRENGQRCVAVRFRLRDTSLDKVRADLAPLIPPACRAEWAGR